MHGPVVDSDWRESDSGIGRARLGQFPGPQKLQCRKGCYHPESTERMPHLKNSGRAVVRIFLWARSGWRATESTATTEDSETVSGWCTGVGVWMYKGRYMFQWRPNGVPRKTTRVGIFVHEKLGWDILLEKIEFSLSELLKALVRKTSQHLHTFKSWAGFRM